MEVIFEREGLRNPPLSRGGEQATKNSNLLYREESPDFQAGVLQFDSAKNALLRLKRGICFEDIISHIRNGHILDVRPHPNIRKYPKQSAYILLKLKGYVYIVPFIQNGEVITLKTIFPSRKATKLYLSGESDE